LPRFLSDGVSLHYEVHGKGPPVVLLHGGTVSFERNYAMFGWIECLNRHGLQVIGLDFRGHGKSDKPHAIPAYGTAKLAGDVLALMDHLHLDRAALVGYSIGTAVALHLLHDFPARFECAALVATGDGLLGFLPHTFAVVLPFLALAVARPAYPLDLPPHMAAYWKFVTETGGDPQALAAFARASYPPLTPEQASHIAVPVMVVSGDRDLVLGQGRRLAHALPLGRYLEVAGADHLSLATDQGVQEAIAEFVCARGKAADRA
jgi:pimeloyl-ACP methyl ester carboxylesterase